MRPQRNAGENFYDDLPMVKVGAGFNEAPAKCRGKPYRVARIGIAINALQ